MTHCLTQIGYSGSLSSTIIQGFPPSTPGVAPLGLSSSAAQRSSSVCSPSTHPGTKAVKSLSHECAHFSHSGAGNFGKMQAATLGTKTLLHLKQSTFRAPSCKHDTVRLAARVQSKMITASPLDNAVRGGVTVHSCYLVIQRNNTRGTHRSKTKEKRRWLNTSVTCIVIYTSTRLIRFLSSPTLPPPEPQATAGSDQHGFLRGIICTEPGRWARPAPPR